MRRCLKLLSQIAVGDYNVDAHMAQRILLPNGTVTNEGCLSGWGSYAHTHLGGFDIPWRVMLPPKRQASNLLVSAAVSASHVGCGPLRLEPQYMNLGHAAGVAASLLATRPNDYRTMHDIPVSMLQTFLQQQGVQIHAKPSGGAGGKGFRCVLQVRKRTHPRSGRNSIPDHRCTRYDSSTIHTTNRIVICAPNSGACRQVAHLEVRPAARVAAPPEGSLLTNGWARREHGRCLEQTALPWQANLHT